MARRSASVAFLAGLLLLTIPAGCSARAVPMGIHTEGDATVVLLPECSLSLATPVLVYELPRTDGDARIYQATVPDDGGAVDISDADLDASASYELAMSRSSITFTPDVLPATGEVLATEGRSGEPTVISRAEWDDTAQAYCDAEQRDQLLILGLLVGAAVAGLAVIGLIVWLIVRYARRTTAA